MSQVIQHLVMPNLVFGAPEEMYVRLGHGREHVLMSEGRLLFDAGGSASFDSYFNSITVGAWKRHTEIRDLQLRLRGQGRFVVRLGLHRIGHAQRWLSEQLATLALDEDLVVDVAAWAKLESGMLYFAVEALEAGALTAGGFSTRTVQKREVKLGIVITHFNRKAYVLPAIQRIRDELLRDPLYKGRIELIVVDNSQNIMMEEAAGITLIPNKNFGGSGGFARGLLHLKDQQDFTHCLFMDDDASCEIESIKRAFHLIQFSMTDNVSVSGSLLRELEPYRLHEKGGQFDDGHWKPIKHGGDMRCVNSLLFAEASDHLPNYGAWWFFAFPIAQVKAFPFPFFVRGDDAQFSLQNDFQIVTMNGVGCWGDDFGYKESPLTRYLGARATLLLLINFSNVSRWRYFKTMLSWCVASLFSYNYASARACCMAIQHVLQGPGFFVENIDASGVRQAIGAACPDEKLTLLQKHDFSLVYADRKESWPRFIFRWMTLNGFLLPSVFLKNRVVYQEKTFRGIFREVFRFKKIFYQYEPTGMGYIAEFDRGRFFLGFFQFALLSCTFLLRLPSLRRVYRSAWSQMTSEDFWRNIYR